MKGIVEAFDIVLLMVVLGLMLPILFSGAYYINDMENWGFIGNEDKTMRLIKGDYVYQSMENDRMTAGEIMLIVKNAGQDTIKYNKIKLPNGEIIVLDSDIETKKEDYSNKIKNSLDINELYDIVFNFDEELWVIENG